MREVDDALEGFKTRIFYPNNQSGFNEPRDWGALLRLVSQDYDLMTDSTVNMPEVTPKFLFERMDKARAQGRPRSVFPNGTRFGEPVGRPIGRRSQASGRRIVGTPAC